MSDVTRILQSIERGDANAADELLPLVYEELRKLAAVRTSNEAAGHTLQPTALVHEAWLRLTGDEPNVHFANRAHFFAAAAEAMRRILVDHARRKAYGKRGGGWKRVNLDKVEIAADADDDTLLLINESLEQLAKEQPKAAEIVKLRFLPGSRWRSRPGNGIHRANGQTALGLRASLVVRRLENSLGIVNGADHVPFCLPFTHWIPELKP